jgi:hypothetical protein
MFNWNLFLILVGISLPGMVIVIPGTLKSIENIIEKNHGGDVPNRLVLYILSTVQTLVLISVSSAVGTKLAPIVGFGAPFFEGLAQGELVWNSFYKQLLPAIFYGLPAAALFLSIYYLFYRPRLDKTTVVNMEELRNNIGIVGRVLYGGIVEEVLTRWGLLILFIWVFKLIFNVVNPLTIWFSIVISGILFALGHLPSYLGAGCKSTPLFISLMLTLNLMASLIFGWLFWQYGLLAAMLAHSLFHVAWYPFDKHFERKRVA